MFIYILPLDVFGMYDLFLSSRRMFCSYLAEQLQVFSEGAGVQVDKY